MSIRKGSTVSWKWGSSTASGKVSEIHRDTVRRRTKGEQVTRHDSAVVLQLRSELSRSSLRSFSTTVSSSCSMT